MAATLSFAQTTVLIIDDHNNTATDIIGDTNIWHLLMCFQVGFRVEKGLQRKECNFEVYRSFSLWPPIESYSHMRKYHMWVPID